MSKTTPDDTKGGYNLKLDEAVAIEPAIQEVADWSRNRRRKSFAIWLLGEITALKNGGKQAVWLSESDSGLGRVGRHQLADHTLEDGCKRLNLNPYQLGDYLLAEEEADDQDDQDDDAIFDWDGDTLEGQEVEAGEEATGGESESESESAGQMIPLAEASDRQISEAALRQSVVLTEQQDAILAAQKEMLESQKTMVEAQREILEVLGGLVGRRITGDRGWDADLGQLIRKFREAK